MTGGRELKLAILNFIDHTDRFEAYTLGWLGYDEGRTSSEEEAATYIHQIHDSREAINETIRAVGGLILQIEDEHGTPTHEIRLGAWLGHDPDDQSMHLWTPFGSEGGRYLSISPYAIEEMRTRLQTQVTDHV